MKEKDLRQKLADESPLSAAETLRLDEALAKGDGLRHLVAARPDEAPNLQWRSALNQRLAEESGSRRRRLVWRWSGVLATTAAAVAALVVLTLPDRRLPATHPAVSSPVAASGTVEEAILQAHREDAAQAAVGVAIPAPTQGRAADVYDWSQLESL